MPSSGPRITCNGYINLVFSGVPNKGDKTICGYINPAFSGPRVGQNGDKTPALLGGPQQGGQNQ